MDESLGTVGPSLLSGYQQHMQRGFRAVIDELYKRHGQKYNLKRMMIIIGCGSMMQMDSKNPAVSTEILLTHRIPPTQSKIVHHSPPITLLSPNSNMNSTTDLTHPLKDICAHTTLLNHNSTRQFQISKNQHNNTTADIVANPYQAPRKLTVNLTQHPNSTTNPQAFSSLLEVMYCLDR